MTANERTMHPELEWIGQTEEERAFDEQFSEDLRAANDTHVNMDGNAKANMLSTLQHAALEADKTKTSQNTAPELQQFQVAATAPTAKRRKRAWWKVAIPAAACLIVGAIAFGVAMPAANTAEAPNSATPTESKETAPTGLTAPDPLANETESTSDAMVEDGMPYMPDEIGGPFNTEEYSAIAERGFVATANEPLSTVSADVDTASYCNVRRLILQNGRDIGDLPAGSVRIEEMLNYFDYSYSTPAGSDAFGMSATVAPCPWNPDTLLLVMGFAAQTPEQAGYNARETGSNLVFLIDISGSMNSDDKLPLLQDSFATLLEQLGPNDRVSIVTYASGEEVVLDGAPATNTREIMSAIYRLHASGSTNGQAGLAKAYEVAERNFIEGGVNRIVMASDGDLNVGITSESDLHDYVSKKRESGIYLSVLGFGSENLKDNKMETLADNGNGSYHYIDSIEEAERVLSKNLLSNVVPFADDVKVQVEFNPAQVKGYRLIGYENRTLNAEDFTDDAKDAGDVGPGAQFTVAYEIVPIDSAFDVAGQDLKYATTTYGGSSDLLTCSLRYRAFADGEVHQQQLVVGNGDITAHPSDDWTFAAAIIEFGMVARDSEYKGTSDESTIMALLDSIDLDADREGFRQLVSAAF